MGRVFERFGSLRFYNEAEVSQNFLLPLLTEFLGYLESEILPEHYFPAVKIPLNREYSVEGDAVDRKIRPDYVVVIDGKTKVSCESKGPHESLDDHLEQLLSYCLSLKTDLLLITNGGELRVYFAHNLIFKAATITDLDISFSELDKLMNRTLVAQWSDLERIQTIDLGRSLSSKSETLQEDHYRRFRISLSDFTSYLAGVAQTARKIDLPLALGNALRVELQCFPAEELYTFRQLDHGEFGPSESEVVSYREILYEMPKTPVLIVGESGIGKTSLLRQMLYDRVQMCSECESDVVPVLIRLGRYSRSRGLIELILDSLVSNGAAVSADRVRTLLRDGRLLLLLDAFDEVLESCVLEAERDIQSLLADYSASRIVITTRHFRLPRLNSVRRYELEVLSQTKVEAFARMHLDSYCTPFLAEVTRKRLNRIASNTLLLTLLILLYKREGRLPRSRSEIMQWVVNSVRAWHDSKGDCLTLPLSWEAKVELMTRLAFASLSAGRSYAVEKPLLESTLMDALSTLEARRQLPAGLTLDQVLASLASTGFITRMDDGAVFWHRAFMEHFAAAEVVSWIRSTPGVLDDLVTAPEWEGILPLAAAQATRSSDFIRDLLARNVFIAARALLESDRSDEEVCRLVVDRLSDKCCSQTLAIRQIAIDLLRQIEGDYVATRFYSLLDSKFVEVQKAALVEVARRKIPGAREIVFSRLDWDRPAPTWGEGDSGNAVIEALGEIGDLESQLLIVSIWRQKPDMFTNLTCRDALLQVSLQHGLAQEATQALLDFFLSDDEEALHFYKLSAVAEVLCSSRDSTIATSLVSRLRSIPEGEHDTLSLDMSMVEVLSSIDRPAVVQQLINNASDCNLSARSRALFAEALSKSRAYIPLAIFEALATDSLCEVKSWAIRGLARFPFRSVSSTVLQAVHPPPIEDSLRTGYVCARVQDSAFEVLAKHGQIALLLRPENRPKYFFHTALERLLQAISSARLHSMLPLLDSLARTLQDARVLLKVAWVYSDLGYTEQAQSIVDRCRQLSTATGKFVLHDILSGIYHLPEAYALLVIDDIWLTHQVARSRNDSGYLCMLYLESLERLGSEEALDRITQVVEEYADGPIGIDLERALRAVEFLAPRDKEDWLLELLANHPSMERSALRRAVETLGIIGSQKSLPVLQSYFETSDRPELQHTCFWAIYSVRKRFGELWLNGEEGSANT